jgi:4-hydroxybenzoate polyprenyltransferase
MSAFLRLIRPPQWIKNIFVFAALVFANRLTDPTAIRLSLLAFAAFCLASSTGYVLNDILDRHRDRLHPVKKNRPLASGETSVASAIVLMLILLAATTAVSVLWLPRSFGYAVFSYLGLSIAYSLALKHRMILDVIVIAVLFVLRALGGAFAIEVEVSPWLLVCTFMLCLFLGFGKRRCEIAMIANAQDSKGHRQTLDRYTPELLMHLLSTSGGVAIITFLLYTLDTSRASEFGDRRQYLLYTLPLVAYGIYRYAMLIELGKATGPTDLIIKDPPFLMAILLWAAVAGVILYGGVVF